MLRLLTTLVGALIVYGSLYPFEFAAAAPGAWQRFWLEASVWSSRGDMLGNLALFVPWGMCCTAVLRPGRRPGLAMLLALCSGLLLALVLQWVQLYLPARSAALGDVLWNGVGCALGLPLGLWLARRPQHLAAASAGAPAAGLDTLAVVWLLGWVVAAWLPLVPSLDWALVKSQLRALGAPGQWQGSALAEQAALALLAGWLLAQRWRGARLALAHVGMLTMLLLGRLFIVQAAVDANTVWGMATGALLWWVLRLLPAAAPQRRSAGVVALAVAGLYTLGALWPFALKGQPTAMAWLPLNSLLQGQMLDNSRALLVTLLLFGGALAAAQASGARPRGSTVVLALWVLALEGVQCWLEGRSGDVTAPLLVLLAGMLVSMVAAQHQGPHKHARPALAPAAASPMRSAGPAALRPAGALWRALWPAPVLVVAIAAALWQLLRVPGVPYNVRELFVADGHPLALAVFALAMLSLGFGPGWLGRWMAHSTHPMRWLPLGMLGCAWATLALVSLSATQESVEDIAGSSNLFWFVTNRDTWGVAWRHIFLAVNMPGLVSWLERCVRWAALLGPLPLVLGTVVAIHLRYQSRLPLASRWTAGMLLAGGLLMWLCKGIAFDWSSTDNLNELIARDGPWGWGGGGWLYALLGLLCLNAWLLARWPAKVGAWALAVAASLLALPLGWWLLNQGLNPAVEKYDQVFSGAQFLLGPDRKHPLPQQVLMLRWFAAQAGAVLVLAAGLRLEQRLAAWRAQAAGAPPQNTRNSPGANAVQASSRVSG